MALKRIRMDEGREGVRFLPFGKWGGRVRCLGGAVVVVGWVGDARGVKGAVAGIDAGVAAASVAALRVVLRRPPHAADIAVRDAC